jgi:hypothetical protein
MNVLPKKMLILYFLSNKHQFKLYNIVVLTFTVTIFDNIIHDTKRKKEEEEREKRVGGVVKVSEHSVGLSYY